MTPAPIVLFAYNRPEHTAAALGSLAANDLASRSEITIYCDGPRTPDDESNVRRVREVVRRARGFAAVRVVERPENLGLARSVITGVSELLAVHDRVIVLEDDLVTSPFFLRFMNAALDRYASDDRVISVCGYRYPVPGPLPETFFLPGTFCWGWGTWRRGWALFEADARRALEEIVRRNLIYEFDFRGSYRMTRLLQRTAIGDSRADSWATRWMAAAIIHGKLTLYPGESLVSNIGFDGTGRHAPRDRRYETRLATHCPRVADIPVEVDPDVLRRHRELFASWRAGRSRLYRYYSRLARVIPAPVEKGIYSAAVRRTLRRPPRTIRR